MKNYLFISLFAASFFAISGCSSTKKVTADVEVINPCSGPEFRTNDQFFRASAVDLSIGEQTSKDKALTNARATLASSINTKVKRMTDKYQKESGQNENQELSQRYEDMIREVVKTNLPGTRVICEKTFKTPEGKYKTYIAIELSGQNILNDLKNKLSEDQKLKIDFDYEKFKKEFNEEMSKPD